MATTHAPLPAGMSKKVIREAPSSRPVREGDEVSVHYTGKLVDGGRTFDSSRDRGREFRFTLGSGGVIKGWELGLPTMRVGEKSSFTIPPELAYGKKGSPPRIPKNATLEFEIEVMSACQPIEKLILAESESNVAPKDGDYVRINMVVKAHPSGEVKDDYFAARALELYMAQHTGRAEPDGRWTAGNVLRKACETMVQGERSAFTVHDEIVDKFGNAPFWGAGAVVLELTLNLVSKEEDINGDGGVVKHMMTIGQGYEKPTDGALLKFHYRVFPAEGAVGGGGVREADGRASGEAGERVGGGGGGGGGKGLDYSKWSKFDFVDDNGEIPPEKDVDPTPESVQKALDASKAAAERRAQPLYSSFESGEPVCAFAGYGETCEGLEDGMMTMKKDEVAIFTIAPEYGFGTHKVEWTKNPDFAHDVPLRFEVTLVDICKGKEHWNLGQDEKRVCAELKRTRGNELFKQGRYKRALKLYQAVVSSFFMRMPQRPSEAVSGTNTSNMKSGQTLRPLNAPQEKVPETKEELEYRKELQLPCLLNIAMCRQKLTEYKAAMEACEKAIKLDDKSVKAHYRKGQAYTAMTRIDEARECFNKVLELDPMNDEAKLELVKLKKMEAKSDKHAKKVFGSLFRQGGEGLGIEPEKKEVKSGQPVISADIVRDTEADKEKMKAFIQGGVRKEGRGVQVKEVKSYSMEQDVAPKVRIAGVYDGGAGESDD